MLYLLPPLLNAAMLALLSTSIPLATTMTSTFVGVTSEGSFIIDQPVAAVEDASSVHAFAFTSNGSLLMVESEGSFDFDTWEAVADVAKSRCYGTTAGGDQEDSEMIDIDKTSLAKTLRTSIEDLIRSRESWRASIK